MRAYDVDIMNGQRVEALEPAAQPGGEITRARWPTAPRCKSRSVILSTGARWRNVNVPGEQPNTATRAWPTARTATARCSRARSVAVIGGGNSGVEAAIDLAGVVEHVTLIEFADQLKADAVLVNKLKSLPNVMVHTNAQTHRDHRRRPARSTACATRTAPAAPSTRVELAGVFVQIGLVPNTEWLQGHGRAVASYGEIVVDERGATSAAGRVRGRRRDHGAVQADHHRRGEGAKAALSAFDHLIRTPVRSADAPAASPQAAQRSAALAEA